MPKTLIIALMLSVSLISCAHQSVDLMPGTLSEKTRAVVGDGGVSEFYTHRGTLPQNVGLLLNQEPLSPHQSVPGAAVSMRLLYTSTDGIKENAPIVVSGALFLPPGQAPDGGWPLLLWSHGTVGIADHCAPTWTGYMPFHQTHLAHWLEQGFAIVASDYQGLGTRGIHPYMATQPEAYSNLDIIRAVQGSDFPVSKKVVLAGQSQGAGAAIATAGYWPAYAPELDIRGVVATGVPYFSPEAVRALRHARPRDAVDPKLGYNFLVLSLLEYVDPAFDAAQHLKPNALPLAREVASECNRDIRKKISQLGLTYNDVFETSREMSIEAAYAYMGFPTLTLATPLFIGTGLADVDTPPRMQFQLMKAACSAGTHVSAHTYRSFDHLSVLNHSLKDSVPFAKNAFDGNALPGNCTALPF